MIKKILDVLQEFKNDRYKVFETLKNLTVKFGTWQTLVNYINNEFYRIFYDFSKSDKMFLISLLLIWCEYNAKDIIELDKDDNKFDSYCDFIKKILLEINGKDSKEIFDIILKDVNLFISMSRLEDIGILNKYFKIELTKFKELEELGGYPDTFINFVRSFPYLYILILNYFENFNEFLVNFYLSVDRKGKMPDRGIVLTPLPICNLINDLLERYEGRNIQTQTPLSYLQSNPVFVFDPLAGPGNFSMSLLYQYFESYGKNKNNHNFRFPTFLINDRSNAMFISILANCLLSHVGFNNFKISKIDILKLFANISPEDYATALKIDNNTVVRCFLNPPYEEEFQPALIVSKIGQIVKALKGRFCLIFPTVKFIMHNDDLSFLKDYEVLRIRLQNDIFKDSGVAPGDVWKFKKKEDTNNNTEVKRGLFIRFYDFTAPNAFPVLEYDFTDSGLKSMPGRKGWNTDEFEEKKNGLIDKIINDLKKNNV